MTMEEKWMAMEEKWMDDARHLARHKIGSKKSSGHRHSFFGLPMLYDTLLRLDGLDSQGRAAVSDIVIEWANGSSVLKRLGETIQAMYRQYSEEKKAIHGDSYRRDFPCGWSLQYADTLQKDRK